MDTIGKALEKLPEIKKVVEELFNEFHTLEGILTHNEAAIWYQKLMLAVIAKREKELGNVEYNFMKYRITTNIDQVR